MQKLENLKFRLLLSLSLLAVSLKAQTTFQKVINNGTDYIELYSIQQTTDEGYIGAGYSQLNGPNGYNDYIVRMDSSGNIQWTRTFSDNSQMQLEMIRQTATGAFIATGTHHMSNYSLSTITKLNAMGNIQWSKSVANGGYERGNAVLEHSGGYLFAGEANGNNNTSGYLFKTDTMGNLMWSHLYEIAGQSRYFSIAPTIDGGLFITGSAGYGNTGDVLIMKTDANGGITWMKVFDSPFSEYDVASNGFQTADGGFLTSGLMTVDNFGGTSAFLMKTDDTGGVVWTKRYSMGEYNAANTVAQCADGGFIIVGSTSNSGGYQSGFAIKTDNAGAIQWTRKIGRKVQDDFQEGMPTRDGGYVFAGSTRSALTTNPLAAYIVKTDGNGHSGCHELDTTISAVPVNMQPIFLSAPADRTGNTLSDMSVITGSLGTANTLCSSLGVSTVMPETELNISPNPADSRITILSSDYQVKSLSLMNMAGAIIYRRSQIASQKASIDVTDLPAGVYLLSVAATTGEIQRAKVAIAH